MGMGDKWELMKKQIQRGSVVDQLCGPREEV